MANLESRIEVLERCTPREQFTVFVRQIVRPGNLTPANTFCEIEGVYYTRPDDESPADFDARMLTLAEDLHRQQGKVIDVLLSDEPLCQ
jgi:hypothetical protein